MPTFFLLLAACIAPMSSFHTGRAAPYHQLEMNAGVGVNLDSSFVGSTVQTGRVVAEEAVDAIDNGELPALDAHQEAILCEAALAYALASPFPVAQVGVQYGLARQTEVGLMWTSSGFGGHVKYQFLGRDVRADDPFDLAFALQVQRQSWSLPIPGADLVTKVLDIEDFSRTDVIVPVIASVELGEYGALYGGPRFFWSAIEAELVEKLSDLAGQTTVVSGGMYGGGGVLGGSLGYRYVYVMAELNVVGYRYEPVFLGNQVRYRGVDVYPALGMKVNLYDPRKVRGSARPTPAS